MLRWQLFHVPWHRPMYRLRLGLSALSIMQATRRKCRCVGTLGELLSLTLRKRWVRVNRRFHGDVWVNRKSLPSSSAQNPAYAAAITFLNKPVIHTINIRRYPHYFSQIMVVDVTVLGFPNWTLWIILIHLALRLNYHPFTWSLRSVRFSQREIGLEQRKSFVKLIFLLSREKISVDDVLFEIRGVCCRLWSLSDKCIRTTLVY
jgi:hypothetical protein